MKWFKCCYCGKEKAQSEFYKDKHKPTGLKPRCKPCDLLSVDKKRRAEYEKKYWDGRREKRREMVLRSHLKNKEHHKEQRKKYLATDAGREMYRRQTQTRYARMRGAFIEKVDPAIVFKNQSGICYLCGNSYEFNSMECDHVVPLAAGGMHEYSNVKMACVSCNRSKGAKSLEEVCHQMV